MGLVDIFFPKRCVACGSFGSYVCAECVNKLPEVKHQKCPMCEGRSIIGKTHKRCEKALGMDGLVGVFRHTGVMRKMINKFKFSWVSDLVGDLSEAMISFGNMETLSKKKFDVVTSIPLHKSRLRERGFNQSSLIAERVADYLRTPFNETLLERVKNTKIQSGLVRKERVENIKGAFELMGSVKGKKVLLVDDVWTTGSIMRECVKVLKRNGVKEVWGLVLAM